MSALGQKRKSSNWGQRVRFTPESRHRASMSTRPSLENGPRIAAFAASGMTAKTPSLHQLHAGDLFQVLVVDRFAVGLGDVERVEDAQRLARIHLAAFR